MISSDTLLNLIDKKDIKYYLECNGYPHILDEDQMYMREESIREDTVSLSKCSDWQFEQEAEERGYYFQEYEYSANKIVELIQQGKDWQSAAIEYFAEVSGKIL